MPTKTDETTRVNRHSHLLWVPITDMRVSPHAQREFKQAHAEEYAANFDLEGFGFPVLSKRDGYFYIIDGQHRVAALRMIGWGDQQVQCEVYEGLTEQDEAELFLKRNRRRSVTAFDTFRIGINAGRSIESDIERTVRTQGLKISKDSTDGSISAIGALRKSYNLDGQGIVLGRALRTLTEAFGISGDVLKADTLAGVSLVCQRYNGQLDETLLTKQLRSLPGGVVGLRTKAALHRKSLGKPVADCIAGAVIDVYNTGRRTARLESWWK